MMKYLLRCFIHFSLLVVIAAVVGCSRDNSDLHAYIEQTKATHVGSVKPVPQFKPYKTFAYTASELRDPFMANIDIETTTDIDDSAERNEQRPRQPLEVFPLDTLRMVGIMEQGENLWGLIKDPQNIVHRTQVGNYMGQNEGRIVDITESDIHIIEIVPDGIGGYIEREASIAIGND